ncbi:GNAT family N-acetyltransferase [Corynebacterium lubricantis]|uniref:GNAT family N-acetyltransferase n=1 Tax=Corynebacterium lubricantis TaxID=541095 RepID=UPI0003626063|nr:GNAT family N-acetyltransferase [Corynebacterium lubricantis]
MTDTLITVGLDSPEAASLLAALDHEYSERYKGYTGFGEDTEATDDLEIFPPVLFEEPLGTLLLLQRNGETIAAGGFIYLDEETAEVKRVWTSPEHRRQGLSRRIMEALEEAAAARGYRKIYLTTGPRQPEAVRLYTSLGYTAHFDTEADPEDIVHLAFEKRISDAPYLAIPAELEGKAAQQREVVEETYQRRSRPETRL